MGYQGQKKNPCAEGKNTFGMYDTSPRVQLIPDCRDEHIKLKLLASPSRWTYALVVFSLFSSKKSGLELLIAALSIQGTKNVNETRGASP